MATRNSRGRKAPRRKRDRYLVRGTWIKVEYFDGYRLRHAQPDDVDIMLWRGDNSKLDQRGVLKSDTLYIDAPYVDETDFFVKMYAIETMRRWTRRGDDKRLPPYKEKREYLKRMLCKHGPIPESDYVVDRVWNEAEQLWVWYVNGAVVREHLDPHFTHGGHDLVYPSYITVPRTVWIDVTDKNEMAYSLVHEITERKKMDRTRWSYDPAHEHAIDVETRLRFEEYLVEAPAKEKLKPLDVAVIEQNDVNCGPTSVKMLLEYDGIVKEDGTPYSLDELDVLCGCDPVVGTEHAGLVEGVQKIVGEGVVHGADATIDDLRRIVLKERRPVLVGWWDGPHKTSEEVRADGPGYLLDVGHFGVVMHVSRTHVWLADPWIVDHDDDEASAPGIRKVRIQEFLEYWYDMDLSPTESDPGFHVVRGWYLYLHAPASS